MTARSGMRLGPYELTAPIGAGGMGEVWRARDTRLDREVAVKILPEEFAPDAERLRRFQREAKTISSLNHPHICALFDVGTEKGMPFLVLELLTGESLADRLIRGPLSSEQVVRIGAQVADALDAAHRHGIVHRDLKPGNVMLTKTGAKLLDFGLARETAAASAALAAAESELPTESTPLTTEGKVVGTYPYMAPEQAKGCGVDARTDVFALGALLFEMATGRRAFEARSRAGLVEAILTAQPPLVSSLQPDLPAALDHLVRRCLEKDPDERWQNARDVANELRWIGEAGSQPGAVAPGPARGRPRERVAWALAASLALALLAMVLAAHRARDRVPPREPVRFTISPPDGAGFSAMYAAVVSPDGRSVVFANEPGRTTPLWLRPLDSLGARPLPGTEGGFQPFWSPDSRSLAFFSCARLESGECAATVMGHLKRLDLAGGGVRVLCATRGGIGGTWNERGEILFSELQSPILRLSADGGKPQRATTLDKARGETEHGWPSFLPDGRRFVYLARAGGPATSTVYVASLDGGEPRPLVRADSPALFAAPGYLLYVREGTLVRQRFDAVARELVGEAAPTSDTIAAGSITSSLVAAGPPYSASTNGVLTYREGPGVQTQVQLAWFDRTGRRLGTLGEPGDYSNPALSPDGRRVAVGRREASDGTRDLWLFEVARGTASRLTFDPADDLGPFFSSDGRQLLFTSDRKGTRDIYRMPASGVGEGELVLGGPGPQVVTDVSSDGRGVVYDNGMRGVGTGVDVWLAPLEGDRTPIPFLVRPFNDFQAQVSPDGRWLAFTSDESGTREVYVVDFPHPSGKWRVSARGGAEPRWRRDGRELFFLADRNVMAVDVRASGGAFEAGAPRALFEVDVDSRFLVRNRYVVTADGQRFLMLVPAGDAAPAPLTVVLEWASGMAPRSTP